MPVRAIQDFGEWEEVSSEIFASAMATEGGAEEPPLSSNYPARFAKLSLVDSISFVLAATEQDRELSVYVWCAQPATPASSLLQPS